MKKIDFSGLTRTAHKIGFKLKKHSPEILIVAGVIGTVASTVMACKATTKVNDILDKAKTDIDTIHNVVEHPELVNEEYTLEDSKKDLTIVYARTGVELVKLYAPAVILGALSITSIVASNNILRKRNIALAAAYTTVDTSFKEYRSRVVDRFGKELDRELRYDIKAKEIEETIVDNDGNETTVTKTVQVMNPNITYDEYTRCFDEYCAAWTKDPEYNLMFLVQVQNHANDRLRERGYLFLNEVLEDLTIPKTKSGQVVGWLYDENRPVDFGIFDINNDEKRLFVNGYEKAIWLTFNVDGNILDMM